jgi:Uma2 family endonuclease
MSATSLFTADELLALPTGMGKRYELVSGELRVMSPSGWRHGNVIGTLHGLLWNHVSGNALGLVFGAETGFRLARNPDTVRAPDIAFIAKWNVPEPLPSEAFWPGPPDLAVEVLSPGDRTGEVDEKIEAWLATGTSTVWVVDPKLRTVAVYRLGTTAKIYSSSDTLFGDPVVPGFSCPVDRIFR